MVNLQLSGLKAYIFQQHQADLRTARPTRYNVKCYALRGGNLHFLYLFRLITDPHAPAFSSNLAAGFDFWLLLPTPFAADICHVIHSYVIIIHGLDILVKSPINTMTTRRIEIPRLSLWRDNRTADYQYLDRVIAERYTVGGLSVYLHKYLGPQTGGEDSAFSGNYDITQPIYETESPLNIQDLLLLENRDRIYDSDVYTMRMVYNTQDVDFDLTQFGLFLNNDTLFLTTHYNNMIDTIGRKLMAGDVLEIPNLIDYHPLDASIPRALPKYYVIQDAAFASEGFSQTWLPHLWRVKATPLSDAQEYKSITDKPFVTETIWDNSNFYPMNSVVNAGDVYYVALKNVTAGIDINNTEYWREYTPATISDIQGTRTKDQEINDAIVAQADVEVPKSGYDTVKFYIESTTEDGMPANPTSLTTSDGVTVDGTQSGMNVTPTGDGYTTGYLTGDGFAPNGYPVTPSVAFPLHPVTGDYCLRLDYMPNRLFRYNGSTWVKIEEKVRTVLNNGPENQTLRSSFVNNSAVVTTTDRGAIPSRQSLSEILKPRADNGG